MPNINFSDYIDQYVTENSVAAQHYDKSQLTVDTQYRNYVSWLIQSQIQQVSIAELLHQIEVISAYIEHMTKNEVEHESSIALKAVPDHINNKHEILSESSNIDSLQKYFLQNQLAIKNALLELSREHLSAPHKVAFSICMIFATAFIGLSFLSGSTSITIYDLVFGVLLGIAGLYNAYLIAKIYRLPPEAAYQLCMESQNNPNSSDSLMRESQGIDSYAARLANAINLIINTHEDTALTVAKALDRGLTERSSCENVINATLLAATHARFSPMYLAGARIDEERPLSPSIDQPVDLALIHVKDKPNHRAQCTSNTLKLI